MLPWKLKTICIQRINDAGIKYARFCPETKQILLKNEVRTFKQEMISRYGSWHNYIHDWLRRNGFKSYTEYKKAFANRMNYTSFYEYQKAIAREKGFKTLWKLTWSKIKAKNGFKRPTDMILQRVQKRGFNTVAEYEDWLANKRGYSDRAEYRRVRNNKTLILNGELMDVMNEIKGER